jgi:hypothetical protein
LLSLQKPCCADGFAAVEVLSETGDLREAAANLFAALRRLDRLGLDLILARPIPDTGLGRAILDRLRKASTSLPTDCLSDVAASFQLAPSHHTG